MAGSFQKILKPTKYRAVDTSTSEQIVGEQLLGDPSFDTNVSAGATGTYWKCEDSNLSITGGKAVWTGSYGGDDGDRRLVDQITGPLSVLTDRYRIEIVVSDYTAGEIKFVSGAYNTGFVINSAKTWTYDFTPETGSGNINIYASADANLSVSDITVYKLESFGNNNHGQIYSGRALEFDGVSDYLDTGYGSDGNGVGTTHTVACWVYMDVFTGDKHIFDTRDSASDGIRIMGTTGSKLEYQLNADLAPSLISTVGWPTTWVRAVFTYNGTTQNIYVNGVLEATTTISETISTGVNAYIGARSFSSATNYFLGKLSDLQVWDAAWTASDVTFDYLNPESLALNNSGTSLTESNLKLWYPMQDGHRGQQSYILDGANTGPVEILLHESVDNAYYGDMENLYVHTDNEIYVSGDTDNNIINRYSNDSDYPVISLDSTIKYSGTQSLKVVTNGTSTYNGVYIPASDAGSANKRSVVAGGSYKISGYTYRESGTGNISVYAKKGDGSNWAMDGHSIQPSSNGVWEYWETYYIEPEGGDDAYLLISEASGPHTFYIDNIKWDKINDKHHATTVFYGDEEAVNGDMETFPTLHATNDDTFTDESVDGSQNITMVTETGFKHEGSKSAKCTLASGSTVGYATYNKTDYVIGRTYRAEVYMRQGASQTMTAFQMFADDSIRGEDGTDGSAITPDNTFSIAYVEFVATATTMMINMKFTGTDSHYAYIDNFSIKEIGTATGWTDADQQLDIPQTALQSYNQLAWFDGTGDYVDINPSGTIWNTTDGTWNSISCCVHHASESVDTNSQVMYFGTENGSPNFYILEKDSDEYDVGYNTGNGEVFGVELKKDFIHDKWHHWVMNVKMNSNSNDTAISSSDVELFLNGEKLSLSYVKGSNSNGMDIPAAGDINLFGSGTGTAYNPTGSITEVVIFNDQLTTAEVQELYNDGKILDARNHSLFATKCSGYWQNNGLAVWQDLTSNNNDGTPTNITETLLLPAGVDASRDTQGFLMNRQKSTNSANFPLIGPDATNTDMIGSTDIVVNELVVDYHTNGFSCSFWVKAEAIAKPRFCISHQEDDNYGLGFHFRIASNNNLYFLLSDSNDNAQDAGSWYSLNKSGVCDNEWHHIMGVYDPSTSIKLYVDNGTATTDTSTYDGGALGDVSPSTFLNIGSRRSGNDQQMIGEIDDVLLYTKELSDDERTRIYNAGKRSHR